MKTKKYRFWQEEICLDRPWFEVTTYVSGAWQCLSCPTYLVSERYLTDLTPILINYCKIGWWTPAIVIFLAENLCPFFPSKSVWSKKELWQAPFMMLILGSFISKITLKMVVSLNKIYPNTYYGTSNNWEQLLDRVVRTFQELFRNFPGLWHRISWFWQYGSACK